MNKEELTIGDCVIITFEDPLFDDGIINHDGDVGIITYLESYSDGYNYGIKFKNDECTQLYRKESFNKINNNTIEKLNKLENTLNEIKNKCKKETEISISLDDDDSFLVSAGFAQEILDMIGDVV